MKRIIRLNESELRRMISESVKKVLRESQGSITWDDFFKKNDNLIQLNPMVFEKFKEDNWLDPEEMLQYNIEFGCDEDNGDLFCIMRGNNNKEIGKPCSSIFEADDKQVLPYLWTTNDYKTAHALDINGNIISPEFVGCFYLMDVELLLDTKRNIYISASWMESNVAYEHISKPLCNLKDVIGIVSEVGGATLFFRSGREVKWVNLHDDIDIVHSAPMDGYIPLNKYNYFDYHTNI